MDGAVEGWVEQGAGRCGEVGAGGKLEGGEGGIGSEGRGCEGRGEEVVMDLESLGTVVR